MIFSIGYLDMKNDEIEQKFSNLASENSICLSDNFKMQHET